MGKGWIAALFCCLALALGVAAGCGGSDGSSGSTTATTAATTTASESEELTRTTNGENAVSEIKAVAQRAKPNVVVPSGPPPKNLIIKDLKVGTGPVAKPGQVVEINFIGVLYKSGKMFENNYDTRDPLDWRIGAHEVISGWEQGVKGMRVGGRRQLIVPPKLGFTFEPNQHGPVPPGETLVYVIDLIKVETAPNAPASRLAGGKEG